MRFQPLSPRPFPRKQGKGSDWPLPASGEGPRGGVNAPPMAVRFPLRRARGVHNTLWPGWRGGIQGVRRTAPAAESDFRGSGNFGSLALYQVAPWLPSSSQDSKKSTLLKEYPPCYNNNE